MSTRRGRFGVGAVGDAESTATASRRDSTARWWRVNGLIRLYGLVVLVGTKLADVVTTAVGLRYVPGIVEANPLANAGFTGIGLLCGLTLLGFASVALAALAAECFGVEIRRRLGCPKTALFAQASVYAALSVLFGAVAVHNGLLIADRTTRALVELLGPALV